MRSGRITSSKMYAVNRTSIEKPSLSLIKQICYEDRRGFLTEAMQWGTNKEREARTAYMKCMESQHIEWSVHETGLCLNPDYPMLGASPDGIVECACCGKGCLEIKCPFSLQTSKEISISYLKVSANGEKHLSKEHSYYYQVQTQTFITSTKYCNFVVWAPFCKPFIERIKPDPQLWEKMSETAKNSILVLLCQNSVLSILQNVHV